uniref:Phospholipid scramblase n=1 Tax=Cyclopterus lumpus TaxID=8103 RepID=A0A8C3A5H6_CYCLU
MPQPGGYSGAPYPVPPGTYGDPSQVPPVGFNMGYNQGPAPVMYQPGAVGPGPVPGLEYGAPHGGISQAPQPFPQALVSFTPQYKSKMICLSALIVIPFSRPAFIGFETNNQYEIKNSLGQKIYKAKEKNDCCTRNCCGSLRSFDMKIKDTTDREVIRLIRPLRCVSCWCPCCLQEVCVCVGQCFACNCCGDVNFEVRSEDDSDTPIGRISKQWSGLLKEVFTDTDNFGIQFPLDLDVKMKAVLMGACFLIDFMFFEKVGEANQRSTVFS